MRSLRGTALALGILAALAPPAPAATTTFSTRPGVVKPATPPAPRGDAAADSARVRAAADSARVRAAADSARARAAADSARARSAAIRVVAPSAPPAPATARPMAPALAAPASGSAVSATPRVAVPAPVTPAPVTAAPEPTNPPANPPVAAVAAPKPAATLPTTPRPAGTPGLTRVAYVAGTTAYLDAGRLEGLAAGDSVTVLRNGVTVGRLRVSVVSSHRAVCDTLGALGPEVHTGDAVRYVPRSMAAATADTARTLAAASRPKRDPRAGRLRGRVGGRWQNVSTDPGDGTGTFTLSQPALDLRLDGSGLGGNHVDLAFDARTRSTTRTALGVKATDSYSRVYRASLALRDDRGRHKLTLGRQTSAALSTISLFDGVLAETNGDRVSAGLFSGLQPEPLRMGLSSDVVQHGAFVELHQRPLAQRRWSTVLGAVTSSQGGQPNRDFLFGQASWMSKGFMAWVTQELDWNRGWKADSGEAAIAPTSTFFSMRVPAGTRVAFNAGFDNRRNVRLYRDRETPETAFDDHYRQGAWVGATVQPVPKVRFSGDVRRNDGGAADEANAWSAGAEVLRVTPLQATARVRASSYDGTTQRSRLMSFGLGFDPRPSWHGEFGGGTRTTTDALSGFDERESWESFAFDASLARRWYVNGSIERDHGDAGTTWMNFAGISFRF